MVHAGWAKSFLLDMGITPKTPALKEPPQTFAGLPDIIRQSYAHEILITQQCNELASHAMKYGNHLLYQLAMKFLTEQQEELGKVQNLIDQLEAFGEDKIAMRLFDHELKG
jgi:ferritin